MSDNIRNDHSDDARRILPQTHSERIGTIISSLLASFLAFGAKFTADFPGCLFSARDTVGMDTPNAWARSFE